MNHGSVETRTLLTLTTTSGVDVPEDSGWAQSMIRCLIPDLRLLMTLESGEQYPKIHLKRIGLSAQSLHLNPTHGQDKSYSAGARYSHRSIQLDALTRARNACAKVMSTTEAMKWMAINPQ
jgi:hypothetical protein